MENLNFNPTRLTSGFPNKNTFNSHDYNVNLIRKKAYGLWPFILESLGVPSGYLKNKHGSCPICQAGKDRFRFDDKGKGLYFCNKCGSGDGFKLLQFYYNWTFPHTLENVAKVLNYQSHRIIIPKQISRRVEKCAQIIEVSDQIDKRKKSLNKIWSAAKLITIGDPVDSYLKAREINLNYYPSTLRFHPQLPYYNEDKVLLGYFPAMLGIVQDKNCRGITIHRTYLGNGCKANVPKPKKLMPPIISGALQGAAIKLFEPVNGKLALAEGIETALAFYMATQIPIWATISAGGMERVKLPPSITEIIIAVDHDRSGRGQKAALILAQRLLGEGRTVTRIMPPKVGYDFADMLAEESR